MSMRNPTSKLARLALQLQHNDFEIIHRPGASNGNADAISRLPCSNVLITAIESPGVQRSNAYDDATGGHLGIHKTYEKLCRKYYWFGMFKYVEH